MIRENEISVILIRVNESDMNLFNSICEIISSYGLDHWQIHSPFIFVPIDAPMSDFQRRIASTLISRFENKISVLLKSKLITEEINNENYSSILFNLSEEKELLFSAEDGKIINMSE